MISFIQAKKIVASKYPKRVINSGLDYERMYIFYLGSRMELETMPPVAVDKKTGKLSGFNPLLNNPEKYFSALKNQVIFRED